jgi:hypothetical protein
VILDGTLYRAVYDPPLKRENGFSVVRMECNPGILARIEGDYLLVSIANSLDPSYIPSNLQTAELPPKNASRTNTSLLTSAKPIYRLRWGQIRRPKWGPDECSEIRQRVHCGCNFAHGKVVRYTSQRK